MIQEAGDSRACGQWKTVLVSVDLVPDNWAGLCKSVGEGFAWRQWEFFLTLPKW